MDQSDLASLSSLYDAIARDYDRPAVLGLLPPVGCKRVLDIGCGPGLYAAWLVEQGARVVGFDLSAEMVERARQRVGNRARFYRHDLSQPLHFAADAAFDLAIAPLMLHYVTARVAALREVARVLTHEGCLIVSTQHPFADWRRDGGSYYATELVQDTWKRSSQAVQMPFWRMSLTTMCEEFSQAGFFIDRLLEPQPVPEAAEIDPAGYRELMERPGFIAFRLRKRSER